MILVTVGTQLPFPRLIKIIDGAAPTLNRKVVAQIGEDSHLPSSIEYHRTIGPQAFEELLLSADCIVAHAGIGTILTAKKHRKPLIIFPRRVAFGEHRNDHQLATARQAGGLRGVHVAWDKEALLVLLRATELEAPDGRDSDSLIQMQVSLKKLLLQYRD